MTDGQTEGQAGVQKGRKDTWAVEWTNRLIDIRIDGRIYGPTGSQSMRLTELYTNGRITRQTGSRNGQTSRRTD